VTKNIINYEQKHVKSAKPIYLASIIFFIYAIIFPMVTLIHLGISILVFVVAFIILSKIFPGNMVAGDVILEKSGDSTADNLIKQGKLYITRLDEIIQQINDTQIKEKAIHLQQISGQIFGFVAKNPSESNKIRKFVNFYYPTTLKLLESYVELDSKLVKGENIQGTINRITESLTTIETAFEHQLDNLLAGKALDIETDIMVLNKLLKQEGL
jgi:5-bromo-4-chloroindolyl phosphate hydrolysis protein